MACSPKSWGELLKQEASGTQALRAPPLRVWGGEITKSWSFPQAVPHWGAQSNLDMISTPMMFIPTSRKRALEPSLQLRQIKLNDSSSMAPGGKGDKQEGKHQVSWAGSAWSQAGPKPHTGKGSKLGINHQLTSSGKRLSQAVGEQCVSEPATLGLRALQGYQPSCLPPTQFQYRAQSVPSWHFLENQEGPRGGGEDADSDLEGQEDYVSNCFLPSQPYISKTSIYRVRNK